MVQIPKQILLFSIIIWLLASSLAVKARGGPSGLYEDDGDGHTILSQKFTKRDVKEMSFDLLQLMGFHERPRPHLVESHSPASQFLTEVYESLADREDIGPVVIARPGFNLSYSNFNVHSEEIRALSRADAIVSFLNRGHKFASLLPEIEQQKVFWFDVSEVSPEENVLAAELRVWKTNIQRKVELEDGNAYRVAVSLLSVPSKSTAYVLEELDEVVIAVWEEGWCRLNVTEAFRKWIRNPSSNYGLVLSIKKAEDGSEVSMMASGVGKLIEVEEFQPFVVTFFEGISRHHPIPKPKPKRRIVRAAAEAAGRRRAGAGTRKSRKRTDFEDLLDRPRSCQRGMLYVNFEDLGWKDWVIAPDGFIAYFCTGECSFPLTAAMNATNHAIVSTLVHTYYPQAFPQPACAPFQLGSISMLYYDDNSNVTVKKYKDMVIKSCGCK